MPWLVLAAGTSWADSAARLAADAEPADVLVEPLADGRDLVHLPSLRYQISVSADCGDDSLVETVSIGVADTRKTLASEAFAGSEKAVVDFVVPARQLAPLKVNGFCSTEDGARRTLLVRDVVTASLSLRCRNDTSESITYMTRPLAVALQCDLGEEDHSESLILR